MNPSTIHSSRVYSKIASPLSTSPVRPEIQTSSLLKSSVDSPLPITIDPAAKEIVDEIIEKQV